MGRRGGKGWWVTPRGGEGKGRPPHSSPRAARPVPEEGADAQAPSGFTPTYLSIFPGPPRPPSSSSHLFHQWSRGSPSHLVFPPPKPPRSMPRPPRKPPLSPPRPSEHSHRDPAVHEATSSSPHALQGHLCHCHRLRGESAGRGHSCQDRTLSAEASRGELASASLHTRSQFRTGRWDHR